MICSRHRVTHLSYVDRHRLASAHFDAGLRQQLCPICLLWFWPWEMEELPTPLSSGFRWVCCNPVLWILWVCNSDHHCGWIHMDRPGRWSFNRRGRYLGTSSSAPEAAHALVQAVRKIS